jgi:hypothetical protein
MWTARFWKGTLERAIKTFAQAEIALMSGDGLGLLDIDWNTAASVGALAALLSLLTSLLSLGIGPQNSASLVETQAPRSIR